MLNWSVPGPQPSTNHSDPSTQPSPGEETIRVSNNSGVPGPEFLEEICAAWQFHTKTDSTMKKLGQSEHLVKKYDQKTGQNGQKLA